MSLIDQFEKAGLKLELLKSPLAGNPEIFQMDIGRKIQGTRRTEWFRIWPGNEEVNVQVTNVDKDLKQLVLLVHEPKREFTTPIPYGTLSHQQKRHGEKWREEMAKEMRVKPENIFRQRGQWLLRSHTSDSKRHFLCGLDERQLFVAQLPQRITTVREAHQTLKTTEVTLAEGKTSGRTIRQGEWFFVNCTESQIQSIKAMLKSKQAVVLKKEPIEERGGSAHEHVADELVRISGERLSHGFEVRSRQEIYVRGAIHHPDHQTVSFKTWRRVIRNNEGATAGGRSSGIAWVD